jgi:hypothetical protein
MAMQAFLLALTVNGIALWNMAPIFDRGHAPSADPSAIDDLSLSPSVSAAVYNGAADGTTNLTVSWPGDVSTSMSTATYALLLSGSNSSSGYEVYRGPQAQVDLPRLPSTGQPFAYRICVNRVLSYTALSCPWATSPDANRSSIWFKFDASGMPIALV